MVDVNRFCTSYQVQS
uniref:Uncharacterized protein n=1 Tax=Arundo donax TaxID=35708 RepID=A0A0A9CHU9_ARUDO